MPEAYVRESGILKPLRLSDVRKEGAAGTIHNITGRPGVVAKLYKDPKDLALYESKIRTMLGRAPDLPAIGQGVQKCVQLAWPTDMLMNQRGQFIGFLMPEVDFSRSQELVNVMQKTSRRMEKIPEFYGFRVLLAANLAALVMELHRLGHYIIDMKPENLRFYPHHWYMALLDTDGFSIKGDKQRLPSDQFSADYIEPEAKGKRPQELGLSQDLFALAVIIFRLMNNGVHPYQGVRKTSSTTLPSTLQERIDARLYAYGLTPHPMVGPSPASIHTSFEHETRLLFDRAFSSGRARPTAKEWRDHLKLLVDGRLERCPVDSDHGSFSGTCGFCEQERTLRARGAGKTGAKASGKIHASPRPPSAPPPPPPPPVQTAAHAVTHNRQSSKPSPGGIHPGVIAAGVGVIFLAGIGLLSSGSGASSSSAAASSEQVAAPELQRFATQTAYTVSASAGTDIRSGPGPGYALQQTLGAGVTLSGLGRVTGPDGVSWVLVHPPTGADGYAPEAALSVAPPPPSPQTYLTSFDCTQASVWAEQQVCTDQQLAAADLELAHTYQNVLAQTPDDGQEAIRESQRQWIAQRNACTDYDCIQSIYASGKQALQNVTPPSPADTSPSTPPESPSGLIEGYASLPSADRLAFGSGAIALTGVQAIPGTDISSLQALVRNGEPIRCRPDAQETYTCWTSAGDDIGAVAVLNGLARSTVAVQWWNRQRGCVVMDRASGLAVRRDC